MAVILEKEWIFPPEEKYHECHASTNVCLANGIVLAAWFGGGRESMDDVDIWYSRKVDGRWEPQRKAACFPGIPCWNPVLFDAGDRVMLFFKVGKAIPEWKTYVVESTDEGVNWSEPRELVPGDTSGGRGPVKNQPIRLKDGAILAPASKETPERWDCFTDRSEDNGQTFERSAVISIDHTALQGKGIIQPTLWQSEDGSVHMLMRSSEGAIYRSDSTDGGRSWSPAYGLSIPNNNSGLDLTRTVDGTLVLVYNPVKGNWAPRTPLCVAISTDDGATFTEVLTLEEDEKAPDGGKAEFSYPTVTAAADEVLITYTWHRRSVVFCRVKL